MHFDLEGIKTAENLQRYCDDHLTKRGNRIYNCPFCGSGTHKHGTAAFNLDGQGHYRCFACNQGGDLLDLIGHVEGLQSFEDKAKRAAEFCGIEAEDEWNATRAKSARTQQKASIKPTTDYTKGRETEAAKMAKWVEAYPGSEAEAYAIERGIDGYPLAYGSNAKTKRLIIGWPTCDWYHIDRILPGKTGDKYLKPARKMVGEQPTFTDGFAITDTIIVCEGVLDAGALMSLGFEHVVALCGTAYRDLLGKLTETNHKGGVCVALDHDEHGMEASAKFCAELQYAGIAAYEFKWTDEDEKDADEVVQAGRGDDLKERMEAALDVAKALAREAQGSPNVRLLDPFEVAEAIFLQDDVATPIPTGIARLDAMIGGGLMPGLFVIGASSSYGKTTLSLQVADYVAASGHPTLFCTIEQSGTELVAKSLSRLSHDRHNSVGGGLTAQEITTSTARQAWGPDKNAQLTDAITAYTKDVAHNLKILEAVVKPSVAEIRQAARDMRTEYGTAPVIFVDYLQLLKAADDRMSDKQNVDFSITSLRQLARDLKTPVWCVASLNRESYSGPVDLDSYKESGSIEFGADYLFGLQPQGVAAEVASVKSAVEKKLKGNAFVNRAKRDNPRRVELTVLKNRQGEVTGPEHGIPMQYFPRTNLFVEA